MAINYDGKEIIHDIPRFYGNKITSFTKNPITSNNSYMLLFTINFNTKGVFHIITSGYLYLSTKSNIQYSADKQYTIDILIHNRSSIAKVPFTVNSTMIKVNIEIESFFYNDLGYGGDNMKIWAQIPTLLISNYNTGNNGDYGGNYVEIESLYGPMTAL